MTQAKEDRERVSEVNKGKLCIMEYVGTDDSEIVGLRLGRPECTAVRSSQVQVVKKYLLVMRIL